MWESWSLEKKLKLWKKVEVMKKSLSHKKKSWSSEKKVEVVKKVEVMEKNWWEIWGGTNWAP